MEEGEELINESYGQIRYNYFISDRFRDFHFIQIQKNKSLLLINRKLAGTGLRINLFSNNSLAIDVGTGLMYEIENLEINFLCPGEESRTKLFRFANIGVLRFGYKENFEVINTMYFQPCVNRLNDYRILNEFNFLIFLAEYLKIDIAIEWRYDNDPPSVLRKNDFGINIGLIVEL